VSHPALIVAHYRCASSYLMHRKESTEEGNLQITVIGRSTAMYADKLTTSTDAHGEQIYS
jgi:hypothetical protein